jgi:hypothetical protein
MIFPNSKFKILNSNVQLLNSNFQIPIQMFGLAVMLLFLLPLTADAATLQTPPNNLGLVGYWSMEDGSGSTATDFSGSGNDGTLTNMDPATDWVSGKRGTALDFDGSDDRVNFNTINLPKEGAVIAWWMNPSRDSGIFNQGEGCCDSLIELENNGTEINSETTVNQNLFDFNGIPDARGEWKHYAILFDNSKAYLYINGSKWGEASNYGQDSNGDAKNQLEAGFNVNNIGIKTYEPYFDGRIDEVRLYNRALSDTEIQDLYQSGYSQVNSSRKLEDIDGLVGWWTMDGNHIDWDAGSDEVKDASGNNNDGTLNGVMSNAVSATKGRMGQALEFDGADDYISTPLNPQLPENDQSRTTAAWIYPRSLNDSYQHVLHYGESSTNQAWGLTVRGSGGISAHSWSGSRHSKGSISLNTWQHIAVLYEKESDTRLYFIDGQEVGQVDGEPPNTTLNYGPKIGSRLDAGREFFDGKIDDPRIYDRALSADEIERIYNATRPSGVNTSQTNKLTDGLVGFWSFDGQGVNLSDSSAEVKDASGNGNNGDAKNGASPSIGRIGQGYAFDGVDDYLEINGIPVGPSITVSLWAKSSQDTWSDTELFSARQANGFILHADSGDDQMQAYVIDNADNDFTQIGTSGSFNITRWHHYVITYDGAKDTGKLYVDGNQEAQNTSMSLSRSSDSILARVARGTEGTTGRYVESELDNIRIYDRALSASEVDKLYQLGN